MTGWFLQGNQSASELDGGSLSGLLVQRRVGPHQRAYALRPANATFVLKLERNEQCQTCVEIN